MATTEIIIVYQDAQQAWLKDGKEGIEPLSIGINGEITRGKVIARLYYLGWNFMFENNRAEMWFRKG